MIKENRQLVTDEPAEFEKKPVEVQDCRKITDHLRGISKIHPNLMKENRRMSTCNPLDLQKLGSQPVMPKNLPNHCFRPWRSKQAGQSPVVTYVDKVASSTWATLVEE